MAFTPDYSLQSMPRYDTPIIMPDGSINQQWYRYWRGLDLSPRLIQAPLADRPDPSQFSDGTVLFIDTGSSKMYYVSGGSWSQVVV